MKLRLLFVLALVAACSGLRSAATAPPPDEGTPTKDAAVGDDDDVTGDDDDWIVILLPDGGTVTVPKEAGAKDGGDAEPPKCDGPCPPETVIGDLVQPTVIAVDATNVYYGIESGPTGDVWQCPKNNCTNPIRLGPGRPQHLVLADGKVFWNDFTQGIVVSCAIGGCDEMPTTLVSNQPQIRGLASDGVDLFWNSEGAIRKCPRATCSNATTTDIVPSGMTAISLAASQGRVVWPSGGKVYSCPTSGPCTTPQVLGPGTRSISIYGDRAYWVNAGADRTVVECELTGCNGAPRTVGTSFSPDQPVSDGTHVYWRDGLSYKLLRCPPSGCNPGPEVLANDQMSQGDNEIAYDGKYVYWTTGGGVYRLRK